MVDEVGNQDLADMKKLLNSWHVGILYDLFKEEDITINELKMMECHHLTILLKNYKMGVRIRFEHHFNNWRNKIGMPLKFAETNHHMCWCNAKSYIGNNTAESPYVNNSTSTNDIATNTHSQKAEATDHIDLDLNPLSPQSVNSNSSLVNMANPNENFGSVPETNGKTHNTDDEGEMENLQLTDTIYEAPRKFPPKSVFEKCSVNLATILQMSGSRAKPILEFYQEKKRLTNIHRSQLIHTIVDFFVDNDYHLSLNASHNLEYEILKLFPTEKLENYRTEKRGKIYVKFSNMKRYKRDRSNKAKIEIEALNLRTRRAQQTQGKSDMNNLAQDESEHMDDNDWYLIPEPEVMVKEEILSENASTN